MALFMARNGERSGPPLNDEFLLVRKLFTHIWGDKEYILKAS